MSWSISQSGQREETIGRVQEQMKRDVANGYMTVEQEDLVNKAIETYQGNTISVSGSGHNETGGTQQCYCSLSVSAYNDPKLNVEGTSAVHVGTPQA